MITFFNEYYEINKNIYFLIITNNIEIIQKNLSSKKNKLSKFIFMNLDREQMPKYLSVTNISSFIMNTYARKQCHQRKFLNV